jgi:tetratricopeptide (TPR) repeat protein
MNCPVCQLALTELIEKPLLSEEDELLISNLPYVIAYPLKRTLLEKHPWTKINLLKDTFLNYLKYIGLITASEFFNCPLKDKKMVALFQQALAEPSFGSWNQYIRETLSFLKENNHSFFCSDLLSYYDLIESGKKRKLFKGEIEIMDANGDIQLKKQESTAIGMLINFRNRYLGHGLTLDENAASLHWEMYFPIFRELLVQLKFSAEYPMFKFEHGETYLLNSAEISLVEKGIQTSSRVWIENPEGNSMDILPFFVVPGEVSIGKEDKEQLLTYESYTGKTIKFFSPEGTEKQTSGKVLEKLNLLLRDKQKETPFAPETFTKDEFLKRIQEENKLLLDTLISEKKILPGIYQHREEMEIKLREWIGARANIFFIVAEAGSGKTNLLVEIQKQYTESDLPSLLIRAGRMEKHSLKEQISYLLNIDLQQGLEKYASIAGTQSEPTFILIDGLNEANNAEEIWHEIIELSKVFEPGSLKFVVTNRANTKSELSRYSISENDFDLLYGENKDNETELGAYSFWLTALNMKEMKGAWVNYVLKDKAKFKPQFNFDDIAEFDRGLYNQINNPLILRLFLEIYNGKSLPKKGVKHLNIWQDWLVTFSESEIRFLKHLSQAVWDRGENELLLDELLYNPDLKTFLTTDLINAPYRRLKNQGWLSRFFKEFKLCLSFTVEASLLYLMGTLLNDKHLNIDFEAVKSILDAGTKLQKTAIEVYLCQLALDADLALVCGLIDAGEDYHNTCYPAMLIFLRHYGVKMLIEKVFSDPTENDWLAMLKLNKVLDDLQENLLRNDFLNELTYLNDFATKPALELGLETCLILDVEQAKCQLTKMEKYTENYSHFEEIQEGFGHVYKRFAQYEKALEFYKKCLEVSLFNHGSDHHLVANSYGNMANALSKLGKDDEALNCYEKCLIIHQKTLGAENRNVSYTLGNIGHILVNKGEYEKALEYYQKGLEMKIKILGMRHPDVAISYSNIGRIWAIRKEFDNALKCHLESLEIFLKAFGDNHSSVATCYTHLGYSYEGKCEYDKAIALFQKCLEIRLIKFGTEHPDVANSYNNIGRVWYNIGEYDKALEYYEKCLKIEFKILGAEHPSIATSYSNIGFAFENKGDYTNAIKFYNQSKEVKIIVFGKEHTSVSLTYFYIGRCFKNLCEYTDALEAFKNGYKYYKKGGFPFNIAECYEKLGEVTNALAYFLESAELRKIDPEIGIESEATIDTVKNVLRLATKLERMELVPDWIKNIEL